MLGIERVADALVREDRTKHCTVARLVNDRIGEGPPSVKTKPINNIDVTSGQSYKHFTSINYNPRVVIWAIF